MYKILGFAQDGMAVVEHTETFEIKKVTPPLFSDGEVVSTSSKHFSQKKITRLLSPVYTENRGWAYVENYINEKGEGGGYGSSFEESLFKKIDDLETRLLAKKVELNIEIKQLNGDLRVINNELSKVEYALQQ